MSRSRLPAALFFLLLFSASATFAADTTSAPKVSFKDSCKAGYVYTIFEENSKTTIYERRDIDCLAKDQNGNLINAGVDACRNKTATIYWGCAGNGQTGKIDCKGKLICHEGQPVSKAPFPNIIRMPPVQQPVPEMSSLVPAPTLPPSGQSIFTQVSGNPEFLTSIQNGQSSSFDSLMFQSGLLSNNNTLVGGTGVSRDTALLSPELSNTTNLQSQEQPSTFTRTLTPPQEAVNQASTFSSPEGNTVASAPTQRTFAQWASDTWRDFQSGQLFRSEANAAPQPQTQPNITVLNVTPTKEESVQPTEGQGAQQASGPTIGGYSSNVVQQFEQQVRTQLSAAQTLEQTTVNTLSPEAVQRGEDACAGGSALNSSCTRYQAYQQAVQTAQANTLKLADTYDALQAAKYGAPLRSDLAQTLSTMEKGQGPTSAAFDTASGSLAQRAKQAFAPIVDAYQKGSAWDMVKSSVLAAAPGGNMDVAAIQDNAKKGDIGGVIKEAAIGVVPGWVTGTAAYLGAGLTNDTKSVLEAVAPEGLGFNPTPDQAARCGAVGADVCGWEAAGHAANVVGTAWVAKDVMKASADVLIAPFRLEADMAANIPKLEAPTLDLVYNAETKTWGLPGGDAVVTRVEQLPMPAAAQELPANTAQGLAAPAIAEVGAGVPVRVGDLRIYQVEGQYPTVVLPNESRIVTAGEPGAWLDKLQGAITTKEALQTFMNQYYGEGATLVQLSDGSTYVRSAGGRLTETNTDVYNALQNIGQQVQSGSASPPDTLLVVRTPTTLEGAIAARDTYSQSYETALFGGDTSAAEQALADWKRADAAVQKFGGAAGTSPEDTPSAPLRGLGADVTNGGTGRNTPPLSVVDNPLKAEAVDLSIQGQAKNLTFTSDSFSCGSECLGVRKAQLDGQPVTVKVLSDEGIANAPALVQTHGMLQNLGLPVPKTFALDDSGKFIISSDQGAVASLNAENDLLPRGSLEMTPQIQATIRYSYQLAEALGQRGIEIGYDSLSLKSDGTLILGDYGKITKLNPVDSILDNPSSQNVKTLDLFWTQAASKWFTPEGYAGVWEESSALSNELHNTLSQQGYFDRAKTAFGFAEPAGIPQPPVIAAPVEPSNVIPMRSDIAPLTTLDNSIAARDTYSQSYETALFGGDTSAAEQALADWKRADAAVQKFGGAAGPSPEDVPSMPLRPLGADVNTGALLTNSDSLNLIPNTDLGQRPLPVTIVGRSGEASESAQLAFGKMISMGGQYGVVYDAKLSFAEDPTLPAEDVAVKVMWSRKDVVPTLEHSQQIYSYLAANDFPVANRFTVSTNAETGQMMVITENFNTTVVQDGKEIPMVALGSFNMNTIASEGFLSGIKNVDSLMTQMTQDAIRAGNDRYFLPSDTQFVIVPRSGETANARYVLGDLDETKRFEAYLPGETDASAYVVRKNLEQLNEFWKDFSGKWMDNYYTGVEYKNRIKQITDEAYAEWRASRGQ